MAIKQRDIRRASDEAMNTAEMLSDRLAERGRGAMRYASDAASVAGEKVMEASTATRKAVVRASKNPNVRKVATYVAAAGAVAAISMVLMRRRKKKLF